MLSSLTLSFAALLAVPQAPVDPEQTPAGRTHFLGREVARTMHWRGAPWLMRATREDEENGALLRKSLAVKPGQVICDLGCGNGYHTLPLARAVGEAGKVFAVDLQPKMLQLLQLRMDKQRLENVECVEATVDDPKLPRSSCDLVLLVDVYHELSHPVRVMTHVRRALRPGGQVVLVEFRTEDPDVPIKPEHKMSKAQVVREMAAHGFALAADFDDLPWQHAMSFTPAPKIGPHFAAQEVLRAFLRAASGDDERIVLPFLAPGLKAGDLPALSADHHHELRAGADGSVVATLRTTKGERLAHARDEVTLRKNREGRWQITGVRAPARRPDDGLRALFDGKTLDGWVQRGGQDDFAVVDGCIVGTNRVGAGNGFLCTIEEFGDFELELDFFCPDKTNSGIQIRSQVRKRQRKKDTVCGYQVEIDPSERAWTGGIQEELGRGWIADLKDNPKARAAFMHDAWNHLRIVARGDRIQTWINEVPAADLSDDRTARGFIGLQLHWPVVRRGAIPGTRVRWKNIHLRELDGTSAPPGRDRPPRP